MNTIFCLQIVSKQGALIFGKCVEGNSSAFALSLCGPYIANFNLEGNEEDYAPSQVDAFLL